MDLWDRESPYAIGVDIGGTKINAGLVNEDGDVLQTFSLSTLAGLTVTAARVEETVRGLLELAAAEWPQLRVRGIGVGSAGQVDWAEGSIRFASDLLPGYGGTPLKRQLQERFGLPVYVDNDVNVLALTEKRLGAGQGVHSMLCLALGTGVGGAIVVDGRLVHGAWGGAGELGHMSVDYRGEPCICGGVGCLEQYASGTSIGRRMRERLQPAGRPDETFDARGVFRLWNEGDALAAEVMSDTIAALGAALASLIHTFNPELIVIGGGVAEAGEPLLAGLRAEVRRRTMPSLLAGVRIEPAYRGNWSGMIGAALQAWEYGASS